MRVEVCMFFRLLFCALLGLLCGCSEYGVKGPVANGMDTTQPEPVQPEDEPEEPGAPPAQGFGAIEGQVCSPDGEGWVVGAFVWVEHDEGRSEAQTDGEG